jgi:hypothetical protein
MSIFTLQAEMLIFSENTYTTRHNLILNMKKIKNFCSLTALIMLSNLDLNAWTFTWTGSVSNAWTNSGNWSISGTNTGSNTTPGASDDVVINSNSGTQPLLSANTTISNLSQSAGIFNLNNFTLTVTGDADFTGGTLLRGIISAANISSMQNTIFDANGSQFTIDKTGGANNDLFGSNSFNGSVSIVNSSTSRLRLASGAADTYQLGYIYFNEQSSGQLEPAYNYANYFPCSISTQSSTYVVSFSMGTSGVSVFNGKTTLFGDKYYFNRLLVNTTDSFKTEDNLSINGLSIIKGVVDANSTTWFVNNLNLKGGTFENGTIEFDNLDTMQNTTLGDGTILNKVGGGDNSVAGGNTINGSTEIRNSSSSLLRLATTNGDDYNANVWFIESSTGQLEPAYSGNNTFANDIDTDGPNEISFGLGGGWFIVDGNQSQDFYADTINPPIVKNLRLNTSSTIELYSNLIILDSIDFDSGFIFNDVNYDRFVVISDGITILTAASNNSHIHGPVTKVGNDAFTFPIGNGSIYAPISISTPNNVNDQFTAEYYPSVYSQTNVDTSLDLVSMKEYWILDRTTGSSNVQVKLSYNTTRSGGIKNASDLRVARYTGSNWESTGNSSITGSNNIGTVESNSGISNFGTFTLGSVSSLNPLPISLLNFTTLKQGKNVLVKWSTSNEINNDYFTVEKSYDAKFWSNIGVIKGSENSNGILNYELFDYNTKIGIQYYRLKQTDLNGSINYSKISVINFNDEISSQINLYPQPVAGVLNVNIPNNENASISVYNAFGEKLLIFQNLIGLNFQLDLSKFIAGVYYIELNIDGITSQSKIIKQ